MATASSDSLVQECVLTVKLLSGTGKIRRLLERISVWTRAAAAFDDALNMKIARFGDNMRDVAVTEGNKVSAQMKMGYSVYGYGIGDLVAAVNSATDSEVNELIEEYRASYNLTRDVEKSETLRDAARIEAGMTEFPGSR